MAVANTLAYYVMTTIMAVKSFIVQAPGSNTLAYNYYLLITAVKIFKTLAPADGRNLMLLYNSFTLVKFLSKRLAIEQPKLDTNKGKQQS